MTDQMLNGLKALTIAAILGLSVLSIAGAGAIVGHKQAEATIQKAGGLFDAFQKDTAPPFSIVKDDATHTHVYLAQEFDSPEKYVEVMELLRKANVGDSITFDISSPGGYVQTMVMLADGINSSKAHIVAHIQGGAYSAAAYISLAADEIQMAEGSVLMFHDAQISIQAERSKIVGSLVALEKQMREFLDTYNTKGVLTQSDIDGLFTGKDVYLTKGEVDARIKANQEEKERAIAQGNTTGNSSVNSSGLHLGNTWADNILPFVRNAH